MKRRDRAEGPAVNAQASGIPPWIDQFGRPVWNNPWGQYRPNTQGLAATPVAPVTPALPTMAPAQPLLPPVARYVAAPPLELSPSTHRVTPDGRIEADDERIRASIQYAKGYAKACKELGLDVPADIQVRLHDQLSARRNRVHKRVRRTVAAAAAVSAGAVGMSAAAAYFTSTGSGTGAASVGTEQALTITSSATVTGNFLPDGNGHAVTIPVHNPNAHTVTIRSIVGGTITVDGTHQTAGCSAGSVTFADQDPVAGSPTLAGGANTSLSGTATMSTGAADACQGATFTIPVTITVRNP